jgi:hypothetical protein
MSRPVKTTEDYRNIALIAAHGDQTVADLVAKAMEKVGQGRRRHRRGVQELSRRPIELVEGLPVRQGLHLAVLREQAGDAERRVRRSADPALRPEDLEPQGIRPAAGAGGPDRAGRC